MPKANLKSTSSDEEEPHGDILIQTEAKAHIDALEGLMTKIKKKVEKQEG